MYCIQKKLEQFSESAKKEQRLQTDIARRKVYSSTYHTQFSDFVSDSKSSTSTSKMMESKETISTEKLREKPSSYQPEYTLSLTSKSLTVGPTCLLLVP